jgi:hypothetical protein
VSRLAATERRITSESGARSSFAVTGCRTVLTVVTRRILRSVTTTAGAGIVQNEPSEPVSGDAAVTPASQTGDMTGSSAATPTNGFRAFVRRRELVIFFVLSYLIAWSTLPFGGFLAFAPLMSAIVVVLIAEGLPGLARLGRRVIRWRVNWIWYAAAIGLPLLVHAVSIGLNMAAGAPAPLVT